MPSKNTIKEYEEGGIYHIYNRGINKQDIFLDKKDYAMFLFYLKLYLEVPENIKGIDVQKRKYLERKNFYKKIDLLLYCLMPNHLYLTVQQRDEKDIAEFMQCLITNYSMYFNRRYKRVGPLFQGRYKAVLVKNDEYLLHLSRYIHTNPFPLLAKGQTLGRYDYSSYNAYLGKQKLKWLKKEVVLNYFLDQNEPLPGIEGAYKEFVEEFKFDSREMIGSLAID